MSGSERREGGTTRRKQFERLKRKLARVQKRRLEPLPSTPEPEVAP